MGFQISAAPHKAKIRQFQRNMWTVEGQPDQKKE